MSRWPMVALNEVAYINPRLTHSLDDLDDVTFVPMSSLDADAATTTSKERVPYGTVKKGYTPFLDGDLLIAKITPCFENSKIGRANLLTEVGIGSTEFHVVRPRMEVIDSGYLLPLLRSRHFIETGTLRMTGSGGQRRVPLNVLRDYHIPLPPADEQKAIGDKFRHIENLRRDVNRKLNLVTELYESLQYRAFRGEL